jgi:hypothetical protein
VEALARCCIGFRDCRTLMVSRSVGASRMVPILLAEVFGVVQPSPSSASPIRYFAESASRGPSDIWCSAFRGM